MSNLSVYIGIQNNTDRLLTFVDKESTHGFWAIDPPNIIHPNTSTDVFQIKDHALAASGAEGRLRYKTTTPMGHFVTFHSSFCDSYSVNNNYVYFGSTHSIFFSTNFIVRVDDKNYKNFCPESGHPIYLFLRISDL